MRSWLSMAAMCVGLGAVSLSAGAAGAAESGSEARLREALRSATTQLRSLEDERAKWQGKEAEYKKELESLRKELAAAAAKPAVDKRGVRCEREMAATKEKNDELTSETAKLKASLEQCQSSAREAPRAVQAKDGESTVVAARVAALLERSTACEAKNAQMAEVAKEMVGRLSKIGWTPWEALVGFKRVEMENVVQEYGDRLLEQKVAR